MLEKISLVSPTGAKHVSQRIKRITEYLAAYPNAGRGTNNPDMRRVMATPYPYDIYYSPQDDFITILGVRHAAQNPADMPDAD